MPKKSAPKASKRMAKFAEDDDILDSDSEVDEFTNYVASSRRPAAAGSDDDEGSDSEGSEDGADEFADSEEEGDGVGMYEADEWDGAGSDSDSDSASDDEDAAKLRKLKKGLNDIPLDTLMRVQARMAAPASASVGGKEAKLAAAKAKLAEMQRAKGKAMAVADEDDEAGPSRRGRRFESESESEEDLARSNKHAPVAMSSKKQVTRRRAVIDVPRAERRDPRFSSISAEKANADVHAKRYGFVPELLKQELRDLQAQVQAAKKAEKACKLYEKPRFTEAREELEREAVRVRTRLDRANTEQREREVLAKVKAEENERRKAGKGAWYLKKAEKKDLLLKARFEALEKQGGKRAVKKVVDKKMKKVAGKEKKSRPFAAGGFSGGGGGEGGGGGVKRRRVA